MQEKPIIISVGGSIIIPSSGFDISFLKKFRSLILKHVKAGRRFVLVVGGGATCRQYQEAAKKATPGLTNIDLDWIGIHTTRFNAEFVKYLFMGYTNDEVIINPTKKISSQKPIIMGAGYQPGHSSDMDAVLIAKQLGAKRIINLSNIDYVYTKDPRKYKNAEKITEIDWKTFRKEVVGNSWVPGKNAPFDPIASKISEKLGLEVVILKGTNLPEVDKAILGKSFKGTIVK